MDCQSPHNETMIGKKWLSWAPLSRVFKHTGKCFSIDSNYNCDAIQLDPSYEDYITGPVNDDRTYKTDGFKNNLVSNIIIIEVVKIAISVSIMTAIWSSSPGFSW